MTGPALAVVGLACRFPDAESADALWETVLAQRRAFRRLPPERLNLDDYRPDGADSIYPIEAAVLTDYAFDRARFRVPADTYAVTDLTHWLALDIADRALADAGFPNGEGLPREATGVVVGNTLTGEFSRAALMRLRWPYVQRVLEQTLREKGWEAEERANFLDGVERRYKAPFAEPNAESLSGGLANTIAGRVCNYFDLGGGGYTVDGACAASLLSVTTACSRLVAGEIDVALAGAVDLSLDPFELVGFARNGALAREEMRVFDRGSNGFWPGEGAAFLVLMREADAKRAGARIRALIRGWGISSDGSGGLSRPTVDGQLTALRRAYRLAEVDPASVGCFEAHGTGTAIGDPTELAALSALLPERRQPAGVGSIKANIGHTKAAAGLAGTIKAIYAVERGIVPPITGCAHPHPAFAESGGRLAPSDSDMVWPAGPRRVGVSAFGFGGINTHIVVESAAEASAAGASDRERRSIASHQDAELFVLAAPDMATIREHAMALLPVAERMSRAEMVDFAAALAGSLGDGAVRAAVVAAIPAQLAAGLERLATARADHFDVETGVFLSTRADPPRIGFVFPGQAAPANLGGGIWRRRFSEIAALYAGSGLPEAGEGVDTAIAQPAIVTASLVGLSLLARLGIEGEAAVGHSLGEIAALHWSGAIAGDAVLALARQRGEAMRRFGRDGGAMATVAAGAGDARLIVGGIDVVVACHNAPDECVIAGTAAMVEVAVERLAARGIAAQHLRVSHAFHSPLIADAVAPLRNALADFRFLPPQRRVHSTVRGRPIARDDDLAAMLCDQVVQPVRFAEALAALAAEVDLLIEVGPGQGLTRLVQRQTDLPAVALDAGGASVAGLLRAVGAAFALGAPARLEALFADRFYRPFDPEHVPVFLTNPCETLPALAAVEKSRKAFERAEAVTAEAVVEADAAPLDVLRALVAARLGLPPDSIAATDRFLSDLHLNSIVVGQIVVEAARRLMRASPTAPAEFADATLAHAAEALDMLPQGADGPTDDLPPPGVAPWVRSFAFDWILAPEPAGGRRTATAWEVVALDDDPLADAVRKAFADGDAAAGPAGLVVCASDFQRVPAKFLLDATRRAATDPTLRRVCFVHRGDGASALAKSVHVESGDRWVLLADVREPDPAALRAVRAEAETGARGFSEVRYEEDGTRRVPLMRPLDEGTLDAGPMPIGPGDVVLVAGGGKGIGAECAFALARRSGAAIAVLGRSGEDDPELAGNLARMRAADVRVGYHRADMRDAAAVGEAVAAIEAAFGPVTGILYGAGVNDPRRLADLTIETWDETIAVKRDSLDALLGAVRPERLRLVVTFGSIIARIGVHGDAHYAVANDWQSLLLERFARAYPLCRSLALEWSVWGGVGMGQRLGSLDALARRGVEPIGLDQGVAAFLDEVARSGPVRRVVAARFGSPETVELAGGPLPLFRFLERPRVHYPGIELVADAEVTTETDPYLRDHEVDGLPLLPGVFGLEAMAEVAAGLMDGRAPSAFEQVGFNRPLVVPRGERVTVRVAGLRIAADRVRLVVRCSTTDFQIDHFQADALFGSRAPTPVVRDCHGTAVASAEALYGTVFFHGGRFRRVMAYDRVHAAGCSATVGAGGGTQWFAPYLGADLLLGDPGARDAALHAIQAGVPHRRVLPVGVRRIDLGILDPARTYRVEARETMRDGAHLTYDVALIGDSGEAVEHWQGLALQMTGSIEPSAPMEPALLAAYWEWRLYEWGNGARQRVGLAHGAQGPDRRQAAFAAVLGGEAEVARRPDGKPATNDGRTVSLSHGGAFDLACAAEGTCGCDLEPVARRDPTLWRGLIGEDGAALARRIAAETGEDESAAATRVWSSREALRKAGAPLGTPLCLRKVDGDGWVMLEAGAFEVATWIGRVAGAEAPHAAAFVLAAASGGAGGLLARSA